MKFAENLKLTGNKLVDIKVHIVESNLLGKMLMVMEVVEVEASSLIDGSNMMGYRMVHMFVDTYLDIVLAFVFVVFVVHSIVGHMKVHKSLDKIHHKSLVLELVCSSLSFALVSFYS